MNEHNKQLLQLQKGDTVTLKRAQRGDGWNVTNKHGRYMQTGVTLTVDRVQANGNHVRVYTAEVPSYLTGSMLEISSSTAGLSTREKFNTAIKEFEDKLRHYNRQIAEVQSKIAYMDSVGTEVFDPTEYKAYQVLQIVDTEGSTQFEKAKLIANLIR
jgi:hypothetical protein